MTLNPLDSTLTNYSSSSSLESALTRPLASVSNYATLTPASSALTQTRLLNPVQSTLTKNRGRGRGALGVAQASACVSYALSLAFLSGNCYGVSTTFPN